MDSLVDILINILLVLEGIAFIVSLVFFRKLQQQGLLFLAIFMMTVAISETIGKLVQEGYITAFKSDAWFNVMLPFQFLSLLLLFHGNTGASYWRWVIRIFAVIIGGLSIIYHIAGKSAVFVTRDYTLSSAFISACCLHYLYECMNSGEIAGIQKNTLLYVALGILLFYLGTLPLNSMRNYLFNNYENLFYTYYYVGFVLNYIMYGLITFGIVWGQKK